MVCCKLYFSCCMPWVRTGDFNYFGLAHASGHSRDADMVHFQSMAKRLHILAATHIIQGGTCISGNGWSSIWRLYELRMVLTHWVWWLHSTSQQSLRKRDVVGVCGLREECVTCSLGKDMNSATFFKYFTSGNAAGAYSIKLYHL